MSLMSMTGYGQAEQSIENYNLHIEIKSVNHRFRDMRFKMSSLFLSEEMAARKILEKAFSRGSFDIYVNYKKLEDVEKSFEIDEMKALSYINKAKELAEKSDVKIKINAGLFLKNEFILSDETKESKLKSIFLDTFSQAIHALEAKRLEEGKDILKNFEDYLSEYAEKLEFIISEKQNFQPHLENKLKKRIQEFQTDYESETMQSRLHQEIIFYMEKWDVDEEITRIQSHLKAFKELLLKTPEQTAGRKIEFILQELGRETNTIGSKSHSQEVSQNVVDMKVLLEKMREQAANVQ